MGSSGNDRGDDRTIVGTAEDRFPKSVLTDDWVPSETSRQMPLWHPLIRVAATDMRLEEPQKVSQLAHSIRVNPPLLTGRERRRAETINQLEAYDCLENPQLVADGTS